MKSLTLVLALLLSGAALAQPAHATVIGTVISGYTFKSDGYWYDGAGSAYRRESYRYAYAPCCYETRWRFVRVNIAAPKPPDYTEGWRTDLLKYAEKLDSWNHEVQRSAQEHLEYKEALDILLKGRAAGGAYNFANSTNAYNAGYVPNAEQGSTAYGYGPDYSLRQTLDLYGKSNIDAWMQQYSRGQQYAQQTAELGLAGMKEVMSQESTAKQRVAEYLAQAELLRSAKTESAHFSTETTKYTGGGQQYTESHSGRGGGGGLPALLQNKCAGCHNSTQHPGKGILKDGTVLFPQGVNIAEWQQYNPAQWKRIKDVVVSGDMPKDGTPLTVDELDLIFAR